MRNAMSWIDTAVSAKRWTLSAVALLCVLAGAARVQAAGDEYTLRGEDLQVTVSTKWAGCSSGGYYPIRIRVQNRGVDCTATFTFASDHKGLASVRRTLSLAQNATVKFSLPVPCVGTGTYGKLTVTRNGRRVEALTRTLSISDRDSGTVRPALLVISPTDVDFDPLESAVVSTQPNVSGGGYGYGRYAGAYGATAQSLERVDPTMLPEQWIAYSGLDFVALSLATLERISANERAALLKWVQTGGSLIVYDVGAAPAESQQLNNLLQLRDHAAVSPSWQAADPARRTVIPIVETDSYGNVIQTESRVGETPEETAAPPSEPFLWPDQPDTFAGRELMLGHVYAFRENPFPGTPHDWAWFLRSVPEDARQWTKRHGITARHGSDEFLQFLIPSVRGVPVIPFLLLITLFTVVIGPLNYIYLWRRRRLYLLLVTIPLIALGTSLSLFGYSAVAHGFATKSRARTLTYVDQTARTAVTMARVAMYAGLAPSDGLRFSADTMVMPIWPDGHEFDSATTDWTEQQNLRSGWLDSRTRTQFLTLGHRDERGRLEVASEGDALHVTNGFAWDLQALVVCERDGRLFVTGPLPAGGSAELRPFTAQDLQQFRELVEQYPLAPPEMSGDSGGWFNWNMSRYYGFDPTPTVSFRTGKLEQSIEQIRNSASGTNQMPPGSYAAVVDENPGVEFGIARTRPQASLHLLMGRY
jgi:hypothetical protein